MQENIARTALSLVIETSFQMWAVHFEDGAVFRFPPCVLDNEMLAVDTRLGFRPRQTLCAGPSPRAEQISELFRRSCRDRDQLWRSTRRPGRRRSEENAM